MTTGLWVIGGIFTTVVLLVLRAALISRRATKDSIARKEAETADNIRAKSQAAEIEHDEVIPRLTDDELDAELISLRRATKAARKGNRRNL